MKKLTWLINIFLFFLLILILDYFDIDNWLYQLLLSSFHLPLKPYYDLSFWSFFSALSSLFAVLVALFLASGGSEILRSFRFKPEFRVSKPQKFIQGKNGNLTVFRLPITNIGSDTARNAQVDVTRLVEEGKNRENFLIVPLRWTHGQSKPREILAKQTVYVDLLELRDSFKPGAFGGGVQLEKDYELLLASDFGTGVEDFLFLKSGETKIELTFYEEKIGKVSRLLNIKWDRKRKVEINERRSPKWLELL